MQFSQKIAPCLWFASEAEEAARYYIGIFPNSKIGTIARYGKAGFETHHQPEGTVLTVQFELAGQPFTALNGGPIFKFNEAVSLQIYVEDQKELDYYWDKLTAGGDPKAAGLRLAQGQVRPVLAGGAAQDGRVVWRAECEKSERVMTALLKMGKLDIAALEKAYNG